MQKIELKLIIARNKCILRCIKADSTSSTNIRGQFTLVPVIET